ncbi:Uncharacterised protein [Vibrio cholerae]|nr:Uncharacterised protein [Vibrio cholerae]
MKPPPHKRDSKVQNRQDNTDYWLRFWLAHKPLLVRSLCTDRSVNWSQNQAL